MALHARRAMMKTFNLLVPQGVFNEVESAVRHPNWFSLQTGPLVLRLSHLCTISKKSSLNGNIPNSYAIIAISSCREHRAANEKNFHFRCIVAVSHVTHQP
jgi:hypothetical protein